MKKKEQIKQLKRQLNNSLNRPQEVTGKDEAWMRQKVYKKNSLAPFQAIGPIRDKDTMALAEKNEAPIELDIFDLLDTVSKSSYHLFITFKLKRRSRTNLIDIVVPTTANEKANFSKNLKPLKDVGIVKKVILNQYMFNPHLIKCIELDNAKERWSSI